MQIKLYITNLFDARQDRFLMMKLRALTLRGISSMRNEINTVSLEYAKYYNIILAKYNDIIIGWAMVFPNYLQSEYNAYFYVAKKYRRVGIGTMLLKKAKFICKKLNSKIICFPHDEISTSFFRSNKIIK